MGHLLFVHAVVGTGILYLRNAFYIANISLEWHTVYLVHLGIPSWLGLPVKWGNCSRKFRRWFGIPLVKIICKNFIAFFEFICFSKKNIKWEKLRNCRIFFFREIPHRFHFLSFAENPNLDPNITAFEYSVIANLF